MVQPDPVCRSSAVKGLLLPSVFEPDENLPQNPQTETAPVPPPGSESFDNNPANGLAAPPASTGAPQNP